MSINNLIQEISCRKNSEKVILPDYNKWEDFTYTEIFNISRGQGGTATVAKNNPGQNPYVGASAENNGITQWTSLSPTEVKNSITVANNGSVGETFYHTYPYLASSDVSVLTLKNHKLNTSLAMFLCTIIALEKNKIGYGRKWGITRMKESIISLPVDSNGDPDWQLMEDYINSLPYSKYL